MRAFLSISFLLVFMLASCSDRDPVYYLKSNRGDGIQVGMPLFYRGDSVGFVSNVTAIQTHAVVEISLEKTKLCKSSTFTIKKIDPLQAVIEIGHRCASAGYRFGDTIPVRFEDPLGDLWREWELRRTQAADSLTIDSDSVLRKINVYIDSLRPKHAH